MEISAIEALTNAKSEDDRALDKANKTLHRLQEEIPLESESEADAKIFLRQVGAETTRSTIRTERLRRKREGRRRWFQHDGDSISENATLSQATDLIKKCTQCSQLT